MPVGGTFDDNMQSSGLGAMAALTEMWCRSFSTFCLQGIHNHGGIWKWQRG